MRTRSTNVYVLVALFAFAFNLRPGLVTVGPLLPALQHGLALSSAGAGLLTALPILALGAASAAAGGLGRRAGWGTGVILAAAAIAVGIALRSAGGSAIAYAGAVLMGWGIGLGGVFVPALLKARVPGRLGPAMGVYTLMLVLSSAVSVGVTPLFYRLFADDWRPALAVWALPALAVGLLWLPLRDVERSAQADAVRPAPLWRSGLAWAVSLYMGFQSMLFYSLASWLGTLLAARGLDVAAVGVDLSFFYVPQLFSALAAPVLLARVRAQGLTAALLGAIAAGAIVATLYGPLAWAPLGCAVLGMTLGAIFAIALSYLVLRARRPQTAAGLSGMAQTVGYLMASLGPLALGALRAAPDARLASTIWMFALAIGGSAAGFAAGRPAFVDERESFAG